MSAPISDLVILNQLSILEGWKTADDIRKALGLSKGKRGNVKMGLRTLNGCRYVTTRRRETPGCLRDLDRYEEYQITSEGKAFLAVQAAKKKPPASIRLR